MRRPGRYWTKLLLHSLVVTAATILVTSAILYGVFQDISIRLNNRSVMDKLNQTAYSARFLKEAAVASTMQIYFDNDVKRYLNTDREPDIEVSNALNSMVSYLNATNYIYSVSLYNGATDSLLSTRTFSEVDEKEFVTSYIRGRIGKKADLKPIPRKLLDSSASASPRRYQNVYTYVMFDYSMPDRHIDNAVVLNIREDWIQDTMQSMNATPDSDTFVMDQTGTVINHPKKDMFLTAIAGESPIRRILASGQDSGYFRADIDGERSVVTYVASDVMGWTFVNVMPLDVILKDVIQLRDRTIFISLLLLMVGMSLSYGISRRMYSPVERLTRHLVPSGAAWENGPATRDEFEYIEGMYQEIRKKHDTLEDSLRGHAELARASFIKQLVLQGTAPASGIRDSHSDTGLHVRVEKPMRILVLLLDGYDAFLMANNAKDRDLLRFCIRNIAEELMRNGFLCDSADMADDQIVLLMQPVQDHPDDHATETGIPTRLHSVLQAIQQATHQHLSLSLTIACSSPSTVPEDLPARYEQALRIARHRKLVGLGALLGPGSEKREDEMGHPYDLALENRLVEALKLGKRDLSLRLLDEQLDLAVAGGVVALDETILRLVLCVSHTAAQLGLESWQNLDFTPGVMIRNLNRLETAEQVRKAMEHHVLGILAGMEERKGDRHRRLIERVNGIIRNRHTDPNLSLQALADDVSLSAAHLGKVYREAAGQSVADHINEVRVHEAARMLRTTADTVNEIAERVGFLSIGHFYTTFRKSYGMTPNDYRKRPWTDEVT